MSSTQLAIGSLVIYVASLSSQITSLNAALETQTNKLIVLQTKTQTTLTRLHVADFAVSSAAMAKDLKAHDAMQALLTELSLCDDEACVYSILDDLHNH